VRRVSERAGLGHGLARTLQTMKTLGLIGGTTWHSTVDYYRIINQRVNDRLGGHSSARLLLYSVNFEEMKPPSDPDRWSQVAATLCDIAAKLERAGAECIVLCANTPHLVADQVQTSVRIPLIHIADATAKAIAVQGLTTIGLLGTKFTMEHSFFKERLARAGITTIVPDDADRAFVHDSIFGELGRGVLTKETKGAYLAIIDRLVSRGAQGVILGCTEIPMLIKPEDCAVPTFDTTTIHATAAVDFALSE
jgi:aspartate racemase